MTVVGLLFITDRKLELTFDLAPELPPRKWKHPCTCTLVAHEQCLLKWIQTSQGNSSRAPNALKCPQCGTTYELESNKPIILHILSAGNRVIQQLGQYFAVIGTLSVVGVVGTSTCLPHFNLARVEHVICHLGVYLCLTAYGAWAVHNFIGTEWVICKGCQRCNIYLMSLPSQDVQHNIDKRSIKLAMVSLHHPSPPPYQSYFLPIPSIQPDYPTSHLCTSKCRTRWGERSTPI